MSKNNQGQIDSCLDEIESAQEVIEPKNVSDDVRKTMEGWIRTQKLRLKELGFKGKMPRKKRERKAK